MPRPKPAHSTKQRDAVRPVQRSTFNVQSMHFVQQSARVNLAKWATLHKNVIKIFIKCY